VKTVGAWEATWPPAAAIARRRNPQIESLYFMMTFLNQKKRGREIVSPPPFMQVD
jgi:hypothetical protein